MEVVGYITTVIVLLFVCGGALSLIGAYLSRKKQPKLAGTALPALTEGLDASKRYDVIYGADFGNHIIERLQSVKFLGYVGKTNEDHAGKMYMRSRWLVVESPDGRKSYIIPHSLISLHESAQDAATS